MSKFLELFVGLGDLIFGRDELQNEEKFILEKHPPKKFNYRPQTLDEYISQDNAKALVRLLIKEIIEIGKFRHILISGTKGHGKTTLGYIIANHLKFEMNYYIANSFTKKNLEDFLVKNEQSAIPQVLLLDEVHGLDKELIEYFYPILEDMILPNSDIHLKPFVVIGATTELDYLQRNYSPFCDRMVDIRLEPYDSDDIKLILKKYNEQVYQKEIPEKDFDILSKNTRYNPRISILFFDLYMASGNVQEVLKCNRIVKNGLTTQDISILKHLRDVGKPVGCEALAIIARTTQESFRTLIEPYLIQENLLSRTSRGRLITPKGLELLKELENV